MLLRRMHESKKHEKHPSVLILHTYVSNEHQCSVISASVHQPG